MVDEIKAAGTHFRAGAIRTAKAGLSSSKKALASKSADTDRVEISEMAYWLGKYYEMPEIRSELVEKVKSAIASGKYETNEKWDKAIENLIEDLNLSL